MEHDTLNDWFFGCKSGKQIRDCASLHGNNITSSHVLYLIQNDEEAVDMLSNDNSEIFSFLDANGIHII